MNSSKIKRKSVIQSVLVPKTWTRPEAATWIHNHGYVIKKVDVTVNFYRFRQVEPIKGSYYTNLRLPNGVELIMMRYPAK
jgi:hypothetical protein